MHSIVVNTNSSVTIGTSLDGVQVYKAGLRTKTAVPTKSPSSVRPPQKKHTKKVVKPLAHCLAFKSETEVAQAIIVANSLNLLQKIESGACCPDWGSAMHSLRSHRQTDWFTQQTGLQLGRAEVLTSLRNFLSKERSEHCTLNNEERSLFVCWLVA